MSHLLVGLGVLVSLVVPAPAVAAPAPSDAPARAPLVTATLERLIVATTNASAEAEPIPSCSFGRRHTGGRWLRVRVGTDQLLRVTATPSTEPALLALYAVRPEVGREVTCAGGAGIDGRGVARPVVLDHMVGRRVDYFLQVASDGGADPRIEIRIERRASDWQVGPPMPRRGHGGALVGTAYGLFHLGGIERDGARPGSPLDFVNDGVRRWNNKLGRWVQVARMPRGLTHSGAVAVGRMIHSPGGRGAGRTGMDCMVGTHRVFDSRSRKWSRAPAPPGPVLFDFALVAAERSFYRIGGAYDPTPCDAGSGMHDVQAVATVHRYDVRRRRWRALAPLNHPRQGAVAIRYGRYLVVAGGMSGRRTVAPTEVYDPDSNRWFVGAPMPYPSWGSSAAPLLRPGARIDMLVSGGWTDSYGGITHGIVQVYDVARNRWSVRARRGTAREAAASTVHGGHLVVAGGYQGRPLRALEMVRVDLRRRRTNG